MERLPISKDSSLPDGMLATANAACWALCGTVGPQVQIVEDFNVSICRRCVLGRELRLLEDRAGSERV